MVPQTHSEGTTQEASETLNNQFNPPLWFHDRNKAKQNYSQRLSESHSVFENGLQGEVLKTL